MKRLLEESEPELAALTELVAGATPHEPNPFAKRLVQSRLTRELAGTPRRLGLRSVWFGWFGLAALLLAASAAATAGYSFLVSPTAAPYAPPPAPITRSAPARSEPRVARPAFEPSTAPAPPVNTEKPAARHAEKPRAGEDPSQVAEAVRALRKQGDPARAQALLDQYLRQNPRGALAEDALALSIEAAAARKDPRAADHARRYLARYPNGRFRGLAERVLSR
jgi:hypothetical protein